MEIYYKLQSQHEFDLKLITKKYNLISVLRLICVLLFLIFGYFFFKLEHAVFIYLSLIAFLIFIVLIQFHNKISFQKEIKKALIAINKNEIDFLNRENNSFEKGVEFQDFNHSYGYDLDIFGENSLFQSLNRTCTYIGKKTLGNSLLKVLPNEKIIENQQIIKELAKKINCPFRGLT